MVSFYFGPAESALGLYEICFNKFEMEDGELERLVKEVENLELDKVYVDI